jgi:ABC-type uncharacterized transport system permease subunit
VTEDLAKRRFLIISLIRLMGVLFVFSGIANIAGKLFPDFSPVLGYFLLINGIADFFIIPRILVRKWRTPDA